MIQSIGVRYKYANTLIRRHRRRGSLPSVGATIVLIVLDMLVKLAINKGPRPCDMYVYASSIYNRM